MSGRHKFKDLVEQLPPERRAAIEEKTAELLSAMPAPQAEMKKPRARSANGRQQLRDTYRYLYKVGNKVAYIGITNNPARREAEHQREHPGGRIVRQGPKVTRRSAERWEEKQRAKRHSTEDYS